MPTAVTSIAVSPRFSDDSTLFVGALNGCFRSTDAGATYASVLRGGGVTCIAIGSGNGVEDAESDALSVLVGTEADGVLGTTDSGGTWQDNSAGLLDLSVGDLELSVSSRSDRTGFLATETGVYRSRNGGRAWSEMNLPLGVTVQCIRCCTRFAEDLTVYAGTENAGLLRSTDEGESWAPLLQLEARSINALAMSPDGRRIVAGTDVGLFVSDDAGETWRPHASELGPVLTLAISEGARGNTWVAGVWERGVAVSEDAGEHWQLHAL